jgi:hypothetical protein
MSSLRFLDGTTLETIYDPLKLEGGFISTGPYPIVLNNLGTTELTDLGLYVSTASDVGDVDNPADFPPATDYQDLLEWGTDTVEGTTPRGGLVVTGTTLQGNPINDYVTRSVGSMYSNRISVGDIPAGSSLTVYLNLEVPPGMFSRRLFININVE